MGEVSERRGCHLPGLRGRSSRALIAGLPLLLAGCAVGPNFTTPAAPIAAKYLEAGDRAVVTDRQQYRDWWKVFDDPTLDGLVLTAYAQNLTLLSAGTRVLQARAELGVAVGELYPQQQEVVGNTILRRPAGEARNNRPREFWTDRLALQAAWELDFWGKFRRGVESADARYLASIASYDDVLVSLLGDVASTYIGIRTTEKQIAIARANVARQRKVLAIAKDRFAGGASTQLDVFQAENVLGATEATIPQLTIQLQRGLNGLRVLLGMPPQSLGALLNGAIGKIPSSPAKVAVGMPADLLRRRPDIRVAELRAKAQSAQVGVAEAELYPAISLTGTFGGASSDIGRRDLGDLFTTKGMTYAVGPALQWNILNYGQITNDVRFQDAKLQQAIVDYQNKVLDAQRDVENGISAFLNSQRQVAALRRSTNAANGALGIAILQYQQGTRDFTTVLTAEQNLFEAENNLAEAAGNVPLGLVAVYRALGGGWQIRGDNEFVDEATRRQMRARTDWGTVLPPAGKPQPAAPGLPGPEDAGPTVRPPEW